MKTEVGSRQEQSMPSLSRFNTGMPPDARRMVCVGSRSRPAARQFGAIAILDGQYHPFRKQGAVYPETTSGPCRFRP